MRWRVAASRRCSHDPAFRALLWPRIAQGLDFFLEFDATQRADVERMLIEKDGSADDSAGGGATSS